MRINLESVSVFAVVRTMVIAALVLFVGYLLIDVLLALRFLFFILVISIFVAYLLAPLVDIVKKPFEVRKLGWLMPRSVAILITFVFVFGVVSLAVSYLAPLVGAQISEFIDDLPTFASNIQERINQLNQSYRELMITPTVQEQINGYISSFIRETSVQLTSLFVGGFAFGFLSYFPWVLLVPVLVFFFLKDAKMFRTTFLSAFPHGRWRARAEALVMDVNTTIAAYVRAQLLSCILIGAVCTLGFTLIGHQYPVLLGLLAGVCEFVPLLGPLFIAVLATSLGFFSDNPAEGAWTLVFLGLLRVTHDYVTYPRIVREGIHLHPFVVILSVLAGEQIAGIAGVFLAVPLIALVAVFYKHFLEHSGRKGLFKEFLNIGTDPPQTEVPVQETSE